MTLAGVIPQVQATMKEVISNLSDNRTHILPLLKWALSEYPVDFLSHNSF